MAEKLSKVEVPLDWPIEIEGGSELTKLTLRRPKTKTVKKLVALLGPSAAKTIMAQRPTVEKEADDEAVSDDTKDDMNADDKASIDMGELLAGLLTEDKLEAITEIVADLSGRETQIIDQIDPEDLPKIFDAMAGFFPNLFSAGEA